MSSGGGATHHRHGDWLVHVDRWGGLGRDTVEVRIARKLSHGRVEMFGPKGRSRLIDQTEGAEHGATDTADLVWAIPSDAIDALCAALQDRDPASERLTNTLERLLEREAGRVDTFITDAVS